MKELSFEYKKINEYEQAFFRGIYILKYSYGTRIYVKTVNLKNAKVCRPIPQTTMFEISSIFFCTFFCF